MMNMRSTLVTISSFVLAMSALGCRYEAAPIDAGIEPSSDACADPSCAAPIAEECTPDPTDTFCPAYAAERCAAELGCCTDPSVAYESLEACIQATTCECVELRAGGAAEEGLGELDEAAAEAVLSRLRAAAPSCAIVPAHELLAHAAFRGTLGEGEDCAPLGDDSETYRACAEGLYCEPTSVAADGAAASATCRRRAAIGEACDTAECADGTYCADDDTCQPRVSAGAPCASDDECESHLCDAASATCAAQSADATWCPYGRSVADDDDA